MNARLVVLGGLALASAFALGLFVGKWAVDDGPRPEPERPPRAPSPSGPSTAAEQAPAPPLTGRLPLPSPASTAGGGDSAREEPKEDEWAAELRKVSKKIWDEVPDTNPGLRWALLELAHYTNPVLWKKWSSNRIPDPNSFAGNVLRNPSMNPEGWKLSDENLSRLQDLLNESYRRERELVTKQAFLMTKAEVEAFRNHTATVVECLTSFDDREGRKRTLRQRREFERRYGKLGEQWMVKVGSGIPGPREGTTYGVLYTRQTHPEVFEVGDEIRRLREQRKRLVGDFLRRYGYR